MIRYDKLLILIVVMFLLAGFKLEINLSKIPDINIDWPGLIKIIANLIKR